MKSKKKLLCEECDHVIQVGEHYLVAPHPFEANCSVIGCPHCRSVDPFVIACEWPDCTRTVSNGTPMADGTYARRCCDHSPCVTGEETRK